MKIKEVELNLKNRKKLVDFNYKDLNCDKIINKIEFYKQNNIVKKNEIDDLCDLILNFINNECNNRTIKFLKIQNLLIIFSNFINNLNDRYNFSIFYNNEYSYVLSLAHILIINKIEKPSLFIIANFIKYKEEFIGLDFKMVSLWFNELKNFKKNIPIEYLLDVIKILNEWENYIPKIKYYKILIFNMFDNLFAYWTLKNIDDNFIDEILKNTIFILNTNEDFTKKCLSQIIIYSRSNSLVFYNFLSIYIKKFEYFKTFKTHFNCIFLSLIDTFDKYKINSIYNNIIKNYKCFKNIFLLKISIIYYSNNMISFKILSQKKNFKINIQVLIINILKNNDYKNLNNSYELINKSDLSIYKKKELILIMDLYILHYLKNNKPIKLDQIYYYLKPLLNYKDLNIGINLYFKMIYYKYNQLQNVDNHLKFMIEIHTILDDMFKYLVSFSELDIINLKENNFLKIFWKNKFKTFKITKNILSFMIQLSNILKNNKIIFLLNFLNYTINIENKINQLESLMEMRISLKKLGDPKFNFFDKLIINILEKFDLKECDSSIYKFIIILKIYNKYLKYLDNKEDIIDSIIKFYLSKIGNNSILFNIATIGIILILNQNVFYSTYKGLFIKELIYYLKLIINSIDNFNKINMTNLFNYEENKIFFWNFYFIDYIFKIVKIIINGSIKIKLNKVAFDIIYKLIKFSKKVNLWYYMLELDFILKLEFNDFNFDFLHNLNIIKNKEDLRNKVILKKLNIEYDIRKIIIKTIIFHLNILDEKKNIIHEDIIFLNYSLIDYDYKIFSSNYLKKELNSLRNSDLCYIYKILFNNDYYIELDEYVNNISLNFIKLNSSLLKYIYKTLVSNFFNQFNILKKNLKKLYFWDLMFKFFIWLAHKFFEISNFKYSDLCIVYCINIIYFIENCNIITISEKKLKNHTCNSCTYEDINYHELLIILIFNLQNYDIKIRKELLNISKNENKTRISLTNNDNINNIQHNSLVLRFLKEKNFNKLKLNEPNYNINSYTFTLKFIKLIYDRFNNYLIFCNNCRIFVKKDKKLKKQIFQFHSLISENEDFLINNIYTKKEWYKQRKFLNSKFQKIFNSINDDIVLVNLIKTENNKDSYFEYFHNIINDIFKYLKFDNIKKKLFKNYLLNVANLVYNLLVLGNKNKAVEVLKKNDFFKYSNSIKKLENYVNDLKNIIMKEKISMGYNFWVIDYQLYWFPLEKLDLFLNNKLLIIRKLTEQNIDITLNLEICKNYYLLNTEGDLKETEDRMKPFFENNDYFKGVIGSRPDEGSINHILNNNYNIYYMGHGSLTNIIKEKHLKNINSKFDNFIFLMGCKSINLINVNLAINNVNAISFDGIAIDYLVSGYKIFLGNLWTVTDGDCDKITLKFWNNINFDRSLKIIDINKNINKSFKEAKSFYTNGVAFTHLIY